MHEKGASAGTNGGEDVVAKLLTTCCDPKRFLFDGFILKKVLQTEKKNKTQGLYCHCIVIVTFLATFQPDYAS